MNRYLREGSNWQKHLENCHKFILDSSSSYPGDTVVILGSGWLIDLPFEALCDRFRQVLLVDIRHPAQIRNRVRKNDQVHLIEADLSGGLIRKCDRLTRKLRHTRMRPSGHELTELLRGEEVLPDLQEGLFISLNLLNQLDILLCDHLKQRAGYGDEDLRDLRTSIQDQHLAWLGKRDSILITDVMEENRPLDDPGAGPTHTALIHAELPEGRETAGWWWDFDSMGHYRPGQRTRMQVKAFSWH